MSALNPLVIGVVLKLEASKTAEIDSRAIERGTCSAQAWVELFCCFFMELFGLNQFSCRFLLSPSFSTICRSGLRKSPEIGKDPDSGGGDFSRENREFAAVCLSGEGPYFWVGKSPISIRDFTRRQVYLGHNRILVEDNAFSQPGARCARRGFFGLANPDGIDQDFKQKITKETKILLRPRQNNFVLRCLFNLLLLLFLGQSPYLSLSSSSEKPIHLKRQLQCC